MPEWCQCADAQECCGATSSILSPSSMDSILGNGESSNVLCPGQLLENYCDCDGDCTEKPEWCQCADAKECCGDTSSSLSSPSIYSIFRIGEIGSVLCPGQPSEKFCDCEGDCTGNQDFCACDEANACCVDSMPVVLCPDQPKENYCDCTGDCTEEPEWCQCADAQKCCNEYSLRNRKSYFILLSVMSVASFLFWFSFLCNKKVKGKESSLLEAVVSVKSPPRSSSKSDDDVTVASTASHDL